MTETVSVGRRFSKPSIQLAVGDAIVVVAVVMAGELTHGVNPITQPVHVVGTVFPFVFGWILVAGLLGIYGRAPAGLTESLRVAVGTWFGAANVGLILRASPAFVGGTTWPFPLVITGFVTLGLVAWRGIAAYALGTRESGPGR